MPADFKHYEPTDPVLWQGRKDSLPGERFFQIVQVEDIRSRPPENHHSKAALVGFCSDEGIRRNAGRLGAKTGPLALREQLARLPCQRKEPVIDLGNIHCEEGQLESAQQEFSRLIHYCQQQGYKTMALGGGHEIAWAHYSGLTQTWSNPGIINFDAHFDLRPLSPNHQGTSGTPFRQIHDDRRQKNLPFHYCCLGIQPQGNTKSLFDAADDFQVDYLRAEQMVSMSVSDQKIFLDQFIQKTETIYLTICLDVFAESHAPGVSAPQPLGLTPWQVLPLLKYIIQTGKVVGVDIAELSPPLDHHQQTARLAGMIMAQLLDII